MKRLCLNILAVLTLTSSVWGDDANWDRFKKTHLRHLSSISGWCSPQKAEKMMDVIYQAQPEVCVEIGVFGGSSIYPTALALSYQQQGIVYAIDPWSKEECLRGYDSNDPNYVWWNMIDLEDIYQGFLGVLERHHLTDYCVVMRTTSKNAVHSFADQSIDILHVDGNHTEGESFADVDLFFSKVKVDGYIWLDDLKWTTSDGKRTLQKAFYHLLGKCQVIEFVDGGNCVLLQKKSN